MLCRPHYVTLIKGDRTSTDAIAASTAIQVETMPRLRERIHPLSPKLLKKRNMLTMNVSDRRECIIFKLAESEDLSAPASIDAPTNTTDAPKLHPRAQTSKPEEAAIEIAAVQLTIRLW